MGGESSYAADHSIVAAREVKRKRSRKQTAALQGAADRATGKKTKKKKKKKKKKREGETPEWCPLESIWPTAKHFRRPRSQTIHINSEHDVAHLADSMSRDMAELFGAESLANSSDPWTPGDQVRALAREAGLHARILSENIDEPEERAYAQQLLHRAYED